ncbi:MAG TPA: VOC family protein [Chloroflexota bacterium]|nr:VOC family protein [Chloroflexota bacterium]
MFTRVERVVIGVADLPRATQTFTSLGFELHATPESAFAFNADDSLELLPASAGHGLRSIVIESDDLGADLEAMRGRGIEVSDPLSHPGGRAELGRGTPLPLQFSQRPAEPRRPHVCAHPNQVERLERTYIVVPHLPALVETYARVLGLPVPPVQRGNVIKADMCIFDVGPVGIGVAQPVEPGPAASALERRGPGPFQVLFRTRSMSAGADWMRTHGLPPPARGTRNTGEQAMLVGPDQACGAYVAFVGPE